MKKIIFKYESCENGKQEKLIKTLDLETVLSPSDLPEENKYFNGVLAISKFVQEFVNHLGFSIIPVENEEELEENQDLDLESFVKQFNESKTFQQTVFETFKQSLD